MKHLKSHGINKRHGISNHTSRRPTWRTRVIMNSISNIYLKELSRIETLRFRKLMTQSNMNNSIYLIQSLSIIMNRFTEVPVLPLSYSYVARGTNDIDQRIPGMTLTDLKGYFEFLKTQREIINNHICSMSNFISLYEYYRTCHFNTRLPGPDLG